MNPTVRNALRGASFSITALTLAVVAACGGGSGGGSTTGSAPAATGMVNLALTDGPSEIYKHVWVTVQGVAFHTSPNEVWDPADTSWEVFKLSTPVTIDLATLNNGALNNLFQNLPLAAGTYRQIRLLMVGANQNLTSSAQVIDNHQNPANPLQWNDQVEYENSSGTILEAPLEIAYPTQGFQLIGTFNVSAGSTLNLVVDFDLEHIIVPFYHNGGEAFTMRGSLDYFDLNQSGAITGQIDPTSLCPVGAVATTCAYSLIVHAERLNADGTRHYAARSTSVDPTTGQFTLYPVALNDAAGNPLSYDVVIRGINMQTMIVTGVTPAGSLASGATQLQTTAITPTINSNVYTSQFSTPLAPLTSGYAVFQETLPASNAVPSPVPYEVRWRNTDPFLGDFYQAIPLENAQLLVAPYSGGSALSFTATTPVEGQGNYSVATNDLAYYNLSSNVVIQAPTQGTAETFAPPSPTLMSGVQNGSVTGNLAITNASGYDTAELVISRFASIINSTNVSSLLANGGSFTVSSLPSGSASNRVPGAYYYGYLRLWKSGSGLPAKIVMIPGFIDLRQTNSVTGFNVTVNAS